MSSILAELHNYKSVFAVCDKAVEPFAAKLVKKAVSHRRRNIPLLAISTGESNKNIDTVIGICRWLLEAGADRDALLLAIGGGVTTDMAGFAASIYKRGIRYANVPTTLLSQVDAAIGGKTGVNLDGFKNLLGVIRQPEFTAIFPETLQTLPERELRSGLAEMLKTFVIKNPGHAYERTVALFSRAGAEADSPRAAFSRIALQSNAERGETASAATGAAFSRIGLQSNAAGELGELISLAAGIKQEIVDKDEFEHGARRKLNLGHTWGHALEWWKPGVYTHGEAVAIGMVQAALFAEEKGIATERGLSARLRSDLAACGLPTELPCSMQELLPAILKDKKAEGGQIRLVLPVSIGKVVVKKYPIYP